MREQVSFSDPGNPQTQLSFGKNEPVSFSRAQQERSRVLHKEEGGDLFFEQLLDAYSVLGSFRLLFLKSSFLFSLLGLWCLNTV